MLLNLSRAAASLLALTTVSAVSASQYISPELALANYSKPGDLYNRLNKDDAAFVLLDFQAGLFSLVQDSTPSEFLNNILAFADLADYFNVPTVITTSRADGPNGPLLPEVKAAFPNASVIARPGQINAWDNEEFVAAVKATGRSQLILAGIVTDVCVSFVALSAVQAGYDVWVVIDASGTFNAAVRDASIVRMSQGGAQIVNVFAVACELMRDWRNDLNGFAALLGKHIPSYKALMDSWQAFTSA